MARYCFYCGQTLHSGEKCNCRTAGDYSHASTSTDGPDSGQQTQNTQAKDHSKSWKQSDTGDKGKKHQQTSKSGSARANRFNRSSAERRAAFLKYLPSLMARMQAVSRYILQPVDAIRINGQRPSIKRSITFFIFQFIMSGFLMMSAAGKPSLALLFGAGASTRHPALLFAEGAALSFAALLLLGLAYSLLLRFIHRKTFRIQTLADTLAPVSLYLGLFMLFAFFSIRTSMITATVLLLSGFAVSLLVQFFTIRQLTAMEENRLVTLVFSASFLSSSVFGILVGMT